MEGGGRNVDTGALRVLYVIVTLREIPRWMDGWEEARYVEFVLINLLSRSNMSSAPPPHQASSTVPTPTQTASGTPNPQIPEHDASRPRTPQEAERFFRRIALENQPPSRTMRWLSIGGWVAGTCKCPFFSFCRTPDSAISSARRDVRTRCGLSRTPRRSPVVSTLHYIMPYVTCSSLRVSCLHQSPLDTWSSTQTLETVNTSFHP